MSRHHNTPAALMAQPEFANFVVWARKRARKGAIAADDLFVVAEGPPG